MDDLSRKGNPHKTSKTLTFSLIFSFKNTPCDNAGQHDKTESKSKDMFLHERLKLYSVESMIHAIFENVRGY